METNNITRENIGQHLLEYELNLVGKTKISILDDDLWKFNWAITRGQYNEFKKYAVPLLKKTFKCNSLRANNIFDWFWSQFGLRIKN